ncbi:MAG: hypothetical protein D8M59_03305 [Planctomycetes bacterium]|nr:hypothetical protein [Planctomycetota bacterium]NOG53024.1 pilus assembly protein PilM [Planctomycetota bacterium]
MVLGFLKQSQSPIAIDFGYSSLKVLQVSPGDDPEVIAAANVEIPESVRRDQAQRNEHLGDTLPGLLRDGGFRGKTAICNIPSWQTFVQHMRIPKSEGAGRDEAIKAELMNSVACNPEHVVIRHVEVGAVHAGQDIQTEIICFAIGRELVMNQVDLLRKCRLEVGGLHAEPLAVLRAFWHLYRRENDDQITTMYVDIGSACTKVMIAHGRTLVFTRTMPIGGRQFDQAVSQHLHCDLPTARIQRMHEASTFHGQLHGTSQGIPSAQVGALMAQTMSSSMNAEPGRPGDAPLSAGAAPPTHEPSAQDRRAGRSPREFHDMSSDDTPPPAADAPESIETGNLIQSALHDVRESLCEELRMCRRYHAGVHTQRMLDRLVVVGGESRDSRLCATLAHAVGVQTYQGDPLIRARLTDDSRLTGLESIRGVPEWAVAYGLSRCPAE